MRLRSAHRVRATLSLHISSLAKLGLARRRSIAHSGFVVNGVDEVGVWLRKQLLPAAWQLQLKPNLYLKQAPKLLPTIHFGHRTWGWLSI